MAQQNDQRAPSHTKMPRETETAPPEVDSGKRDRKNLDRGSLDEPNAAQRQSDATNDVVSLVGVEEPTLGTTSDANGRSSADEADGPRRRKQYESGVELVSKPD